MAMPRAHSNGYRVSEPRLAWRTTICTVWTATSVRCSSLLPLLHQLSLWSKPKLKRSKYESTTGTIMTYHNWNAHEDRAYRHYLVVHHRSYVIYGKQHHKVQRHYWNYRHTYPDRY